MRVRAGARFTLTSPLETPAVFMIRPEDTALQRVLAEDWSTSPPRGFHDYIDVYGNHCRRATLPAGTFALDYEVLVETTAELDPLAADAIEHPISDVPDGALMYTLPSRYCLSDVIFPQAHELFGGIAPGWGRVQAICDWVHTNVRFAYGSYRRDDGNRRPRQRQRCLPRFRPRRDRVLSRAQYPGAVRVWVHARYRRDGLRGTDGLLCLVRSLSLWNVVDLRRAK